MKKRNILKLESFLPRGVFLGLLNRKRVVFADVREKIEITENVFFEFNQLACTTNSYELRWNYYMENLILKYTH